MAAGVGFGPVLGAGGAHRPGARPPSPLPAAETEARQFKGSLWGPRPLLRRWPFCLLPRCSLRTGLTVETKRYHPRC